MKKVSLLSLAMLLAAHVSFAQVFSSSFEEWTNPNSPVGWLGSTTHTTNLAVNQSNDAQSGSFSCQLITTGTTHRRFSTQPIAATAGTVYSISFYIKGSGEVRTGLANAPFGPDNFQTYNSYVQASSEWTQHTQQITASSTGDVQFIFSVLETAQPNHILLDNVVITTASVNTVTINAIQFTTNPNGDSPLVGQTVTTQGVVTGTYVTTTNQHGYFIQDAPGAWNGIHVFQGTNSNLPTLGNQVQVTGNVAEFNGLTQLTNVTTVILNPSAPLPNAVDITSLQLSQEEQWEGVLVRVVDAACTEQNSGFGMWEINDGSGPAKVHNLMNVFTPTLGAVYNITGVVNFAFSEYRICPRNNADIVVVNSNVQEVTIQQIQSITAPDGASPLLGQTVSTRGVVTAIKPNEGFFIQDGSGPWRGIFIFNSTINPAMGDSIALTGNVNEHFGLTQLSSISNHQIVSSGNTIPAASVVTTAQANTEQYESVLVRVENAICTNANAGFGMFRLNNSTADMLVDDDIFAFTAVLGNGYNAQGPMWFSFGEFKMLPRMASDIELIGFASTEQNAFEAVVVYPNPSNDVITIANYDGEITILDASGRKVQVLEVTHNNNSLNISNFDSGIYFIVTKEQIIRFVKK